MENLSIDQHRLLARYYAHRQHSNNPKHRQLLWRYLYLKADEEEVMEMRRRQEEEEAMEQWEAKEKQVVPNPPRESDRVSSMRSADATSAGPMNRALEKISSADDDGELVTADEGSSV